MAAGTVAVLLPVHLAPMGFTLRAVYARAVRPPSPWNKPFRGCDTWAAHSWPSEMPAICRGRVTPCGRVEPTQRPNGPPNTSHSTVLSARSFRGRSEGRLMAESGSTSRPPEADLEEWTHGSGGQLPGAAANRYSRPQGDVRGASRKRALGCRCRLVCKASRRKSSAHSLRARPPAGVCEAKRQASFVHLSIEGL